MARAHRNGSISALLWLPCLLPCLFAGIGWTAAEYFPQIADLSDISIDPETGDRMYRGRPFTGEARRYGANGTLVRAEQFTDGRRNGHLKMWFASGVPAYEAMYAAGRREGTATSWWSNGRKRSTTHFVDDRAEGIAWSWYRSGEKFKRHNYSRGQPAGLQQGWRRNGTLFSNFEIRNGRAYGLRNSNLCVGLEDEQIAIGP